MSLQQVTLLVRHTATFHVLDIFFFNDPPTTEIYTLSLHDALPICGTRPFKPTSFARTPSAPASGSTFFSSAPSEGSPWVRSEEHTSELQSLRQLVCRLLLEKKKVTS